MTDLTKAPADLVGDVDWALDEMFSNNDGRRSPDYLCHFLAKRGLVIVPKEPTKAMLDAYIGALDEKLDVTDPKYATHKPKARRRWLAMIEACGSAGGSCERRSAVSQISEIGMSAPPCEWEWAPEYAWARRNVP